jgi:hypothetical protein
VTVAGLTSAGVYLLWSRDLGWFSIVMLLCATGLIAYQMWLNNFYWRRSMNF